MTKQEIITAAFRVWGRNLYKKTSLSELAQELGVSKSALYRHFKSKETLADAMAASFLDDFAASVRDDFQQALKSKDADKGIFTIIRSIAGYFARNAYALIFSLVNIYDRNLDDYMINEHLEKRGADMKTLLAVIEKKYDCDLTLLKLIFATLIFFMSHFHKTNNSFENVPSEKDIENIISTIYEITEHGLGYTRTNARARVHEKELSLDFEKLEKQVEGILQIAEPEPLFKAVAEAVAEAGPWDASMEMVAKRAGFSKSSLYGHFKNRTDMLRRLFKLEFTRIIEFARQAITLSENNTAEQLYLGIYSIAVYLRSRPEILISLGWIRTRKLDLGKPDNTEIFRLFEDVKIEGLKTENEKERASHWILFLLINILSQPNSNVSNGDLRMLYKFITFGLGGFKKLKKNCYTNNVLKGGANVCAALKEVRAYAGQNVCEKQTGFRMKTEESL